MFSQSLFFSQTDRVMTWGTLSVTYRAKCDLIQFKLWPKICCYLQSEGSKNTKFPQVFILIMVFWENLKKTTLSNSSIVWYTFMSWRKWRHPPLPALSPQLHVPHLLSTPPCAQPPHHALAAEDLHPQQLPALQAAEERSTRAGEGEVDDSDMELILLLLVNKFLNLFVLETKST